MIRAAVSAVPPIEIDRVAGVSVTRGDVITPSSSGSLPKFAAARCPA